MLPVDSSSTLAQADGGGGKVRWSIVFRVAVRNVRFSGVEEYASTRPRLAISQDISDGGRCSRIYDGDTETVDLELLDFGEVLLPFR